MPANSAGTAAAGAAAAQPAAAAALRARAAWGWGLAAVGALAVLPYLNALNAFWVGDDYNYVVPKTAETILNFFNPLGRAQYRPFNWLTWAGDYALFGPNPPGWHLTQLLMHVAITLVFAAMLGILARAWWPGDGMAQRWIPLLGAALFAVQPSHPEAVTWIGGRADVPFALGLALAAWALARWRAGGRRQAGWYLLAVAGTWLSILGKEAGLITPLALLLVDWLLPDPGAPPAAPPPAVARGVARYAAEGVARVAAFAVIFVVPLVLLGRGDPTAPVTLLWSRLTPVALLLVGLRVPRSPRGAPLPRLVALARDQAPFLALAAAYAVLRIGLYLNDLGRLMYGTAAHLQFSPRALLDAAAGYLLVGIGAWQVPADIAGWPLAVSLGVVLVALVAAVLAVRAWGRPALFAVLWVPATALVTYDSVADRWFYVPSLGVCLLAALAAWALARRRQAVGAVGAAALLVVWSAITVDVNARWVASGEVARGLIAQIRALVPDPPRPATFYMANPPYFDAGVLLFNSGFSEAPSYAYQDYTAIHGYELREHAAQVAAALADPAQIGPHPYFLRYEAGRLVAYPTLAALVAAQQGP